MAAREQLVHLRVVGGEVTWYVHRLVIFPAVRELQFVVCRFRSAPLEHHFRAYGQCKDELDVDQRPAGRRLPDGP